MTCTVDRDTGHPEEVGESGLGGAAAAAALFGYSRAPKMVLPTRMLVLPISICGAAHRANRA